MATFARESAHYASGPEIYETYPEASGQSFKEGECVYLVSGKVTACLADAVVILGLATGDASGTADTDCRVLVVTPETLLEMTAYSDGGGVNDVVAVTDIGVKFALVVESNKSLVDTSDTDHDAFVIHRNLNAVGDIFPRVLASVIPAAIQAGTAAT